MIKLRNCSWNEFSERIADRNLYCFGSGNIVEWLSTKISGVNIVEKICAIVDNDSRKVGKVKIIDDKAIPIISFQNFVKERSKNAVMLITSMYYKEMICQMDDIEALNNLECYIEVFLNERIYPMDNSSLARGDKRIPKIIHYCWFGGKEIPSEYKMYMESWKKYCPDYEIMRWDESNYDYCKIPYMKQAYEAGKYAFVSDYARLDVVYNYGGIYLDTDVEVVKNLDTLLANDMYCGFEQGNYVSTGLGFGACKGYKHVKQMRDMYHTVQFVDEKKCLNLTACTAYQTEYLMKLGLKRDGTCQLIDGIRVYPRTVLAPLDFYGIYNYTTEFTHTIHHYAATWFQGNTREQLLQMNDVIKQRMEKKNV